MQVPAVCDNCGTIFPSGIEATNSTIIIEKCKSGPCPACGGMGDIIDGTFDFVGNAINVRRAPPRTIEVLRVLQEALALANAERPAEEISEKLAEVSPEIASQASTFYARGGLPLLGIFLLFLLSQCANNTTGSINWNVALDQAITSISGGEPYPGLTTGSVESEPSGSAERAPQSQSEEKLGPRKPRSSRPPHPPKKPSPEASSRSKQDDLALPSKPPKKRNHMLKRKERATRRAAMKGRLC